MKKKLHPDSYRPVVFQDLGTGTTFLTRSTVAAEDTIKLPDGNQYPLVKVHISSSSHPFFTGQEKLVDIEGRVDKFKARRQAGQASREARLSAVAKKTSSPDAKKTAAKKPASKPATS